ncbi:MAG: STAS domain-containing protein [Phycisphaerales bacterium]|jgi:anti-anti-sigma factor|nr:STAS domain-containing protein [Phycisphaerales bacterium]
MRIEEHKHGAVTVLKPAGALVAEDAKSFGGRLRSILRSSMGRLVIDATGIAYADSTGLQLLADCARELDAGGFALKLCGVNDTVREAMELTEIGGLFEHYAQVPDAVRSFL